MTNELDKSWARLRLETETANTDDLRRADTEWEPVNSGKGHQTAYRQIYDDTALIILTLSGLSKPAITDAAMELQVGYELFCADRPDAYFPDLCTAYTAMLESWRQESDMPWPADGYSSLNGFTLAQLYLAMAWEQNGIAKHLLDGDAIAHGWDAREAFKIGVATAVSVAKLVARSQLIIATGSNALAQKPV